MGGDDYVIDEARGKAWANAHEALKWYREQLDIAEARLDDIEQDAIERDFLD